MWYVYEIVNNSGIVEYVGETINPKRRLSQHKYKRFRNRKDVRMEIVKTFDNRKDAFWYQVSLQKEFNLVTDCQLKRNGYDAAWAKQEKIKYEDALEIKRRMENEFVKDIAISLGLNRDSIRKAFKRYNLYSDMRSVNSGRKK